MSERRACRVIDADRKSVRYRSTRDDDAGLREKLRELANQTHFGILPCGPDLFSGLVLEKLIPVPATRISDFQNHL